MISQILKRIFGGPPVSLNVRIFDVQSSLQRNAEAWGYAPIYLKKAADPNIDSIERLKYIITFIVSGLVVTCKQLKPFNPLIGETFEGEFSDGSKVYAEHIGHYPTLSRFLMIGNDNDFKLHGCFDLDAKTESFGGVIFIIQKGDMIIELPKINQKYKYRMPIMKLENCRSEEERNCFITDFLEVEDMNNNLKAIIHFGCQKKKICDFRGTIFNHNSNEIFERKKVEKYMDKFEDFLEAKDLKKKQKIMNDYPYPKILISGSFVQNISFDGIDYWNLDNDKAYVLKPIKFVLPSDSRFREDLLWLFFASYYSRNKEEYDQFMKISQGWKTETEFIQRKERGIRAEYKKKLKKK